jgi:hypothetical protein
MNTKEKSKEQIRLHAWAHYIVHACNTCGVLSSSATGIYHHNEKAHHTKSYGTKIDRESWHAARDKIQIQKKCPPLPYSTATHHRTSTSRDRRRPLSPPVDIDLRYADLKLPTISKPISPIRGTPRKPETSTTYYKSNRPPKPATETQPYRVSYQEQQLKLKYIDRELAFLNKLKGDHVRTLASIDEKMATLTKERVGIKYPVNTH